MLQRRKSYLAENLAEEQERWFLWLPVLFGCGIGLYFALPEEPSKWWSLAAFELILLFAWIWRFQPRRLWGLFGAAIVVLGFINVQMKTLYLAREPIISEALFNEIQKIKGMFIKAENQPCLELLENISEDGPLTNYLKKGNKFYHFAYITTNIEKSMADFMSQGAIPVVKITKATYFEKICFLMMKNMMLIELVEAKS